MSEFSINNIKEIQQLIIPDEVNKTEVRNCSGGFFNRVSSVLTVCGNRISFFIKNKVFVNNEKIKQQLEKDIKRTDKSLIYLSNEDLKDNLLRISSKIEGMQQICKELEKGGIDKQSLSPLQTKLEQLSKQMSLRASLETVQQVGLAQNSLETIKQAALAQGAPFEEIELIIKHGEARLQKAENPTAQHEIQLQITQAIQHLGETSQLAQKIGNKAANLHRLDKIFPGQVPYHRECLDSDVLAYVRQRSPQFDHLWQQVVDYLNQGGAIEQADHLLDPIQEEIKRVFAEATDFPNDADLKAFQALGHPIIVRSTSREDTLKVANQGGGTSVPNISPNRESIQKMNPFGIVLASYFSKKSFAQRKAQGDNLTELPFMAVAIQVMKSPVISGVMFSTEGELNTPGVCQISADFGFAGVVTGARPSDTYYVQDQFVHAVVAEKFVRDVPQADGTIAAVANSAKLQKRTCLTENQALYLSKMAKRIEEEYGYPMDIEWGYDIQTDTFYLFQARPIPLKEPSQPSYLDPEKMKNLQDTQYVTVIGAGSAEVKELKRTNTIIANSAPLALKEYLENPNRPYQAILIGNPTAHNSHEAGFFRQRGIPLIYLTADQYSHATTTLKTQTLLVDTQEGVLATLPPDQQAKDFMCEGLRHHVVPKMESLGRKLASWELSAFRRSLEEKAQGANLAQIPQTIGRNLLDRALNAFEQAERLEEKAYILQKLLEIVESKLKKVPESERQEILDKIFYNAQHVWKVYQNPQMEEVNHKFAMSWLRTALLRSPVEGVVKSGTLYQTLGGIKERGQLKLAAHETDSKAAYLDIFQRSQKFIFSPPTRENWKTFISHLKEEDLQQLAMLFAKLGPSIVEVWLNSRFPAIWQKQQNSSACLKAVLKELVGSEIDQSLALSKQANALMAQFNASDFSDPTQFNQLHQELKEKLLPLALNCVDKMKNAKEVDRTLLAHTFGKLVATFDNCIKDLTTSTLYTDEQKAEYFGALLDSYVNLAEAAMDKSMLNHDPTLVRQAFKLTPYLKKRLSALKEEAKNNPSAALLANPQFSVIMAALGSGAMAPKRMPPRSLEDFFTLIHQSLITVEQSVANQSGIPLSQLPSSLQNLCAHLMQIDLHSRRVGSDVQQTPNIQSIHYHYPTVTIALNSPLANHSAQFIVEATLNPDGSVTSITFEGRFFAPIISLAHFGRDENLNAYAFASYYDPQHPMQAPTGFRMERKANIAQFKWILNKEKSWNPAIKHLQNMIDFLQDIDDLHFQFIPDLLKDHPWVISSVKYEFKKQDKTQLEQITTAFMQGVLNNFTEENIDHFLKVHSLLFGVHHDQNSFLNKELLEQIIDRLLEENLSELSLEELESRQRFFTTINPNNHRQDYQGTKQKFESYALLTPERENKIKNYYEKASSG